MKLKKMTERTFKEKQEVKILDSNGYNPNIVNKKGVIVAIKEDVCNVYIPMFPTLPYKDNIFTFNYSQIK